MDQVSTTLLRLNLETTSSHEAADACWYDLLRPGVSRFDYVAQLVACAGFEGPLEAALAYTPGLKDALDLRARSKVGLLAQDLLALGLSPADLSDVSNCDHVPREFSSAPEALGWLYVSERATRQFDRVCSFLERHLRVPMTTTRYLRAYDGLVGLRWNELGHALDRTITTPSQLAQLVQSAQIAFSTWTAWHSGRRMPRAAHG